MNTRIKTLAIATSAGLVLLAGAAGAAPTNDSRHPPAEAGTLPAGARVTVAVRSATADFALREADALRLARAIEAQLPVPAADGAAPQYRVDIAIVNYDKGNNYVRAMLAGPGQIHTDTEVAILREPGAVEVSRYTVAKTFPPEGIYGSASRLGDIEALFVQSLVAALRGMPEPVETARSG